MLRSTAVLLFLLVFTVGACGGDAAGPTDAASRRLAKTDTRTDSVTRPGGGTTPVERFELAVFVRAAEPGADTSNSAPLPDATVTLYRTMTAQGDSLDPEVTVGTVTTDAQGVATFGDLPAAYYRAWIKPPAGRGLQEATRGLAPPIHSKVGMQVTLQRAP